MKTVYVKKVVYLFLFCALAIFSLAFADQQQLTNQLQKALVTAVTNSETTPGAVLLVSSPTTGTITIAAGYADKSTKTPMTVNNNFRLASISKTFLAVVVLKLVEEGKLRLDDKIKDLLPNSIDVNRIPNGNKVTVRELLHMRSGIPNYTEYDAYSEFVKTHLEHRWTPEDAVELIYDKKPDFIPDESYEYSNTNYVLLQSIVEELTGTPLAAQFQKYIFGPLHLTHTYQEVQETKPGGFNGLITHGYDEEDDELIDVTTYNDGWGLGDGGIISTAQDLATFVQALLQYKTLLSENSLKEMFKVRGPDKYGLGIYREEMNDEWAWTHNGSSSGFGTQYYYLPNYKLTIIILTNSYETDIIDDLGEEVFDILEKSQQKSVAHL